MRRNRPSRIPFTRLGSALWLSCFSKFLEPEYHIWCAHFPHSLSLLQPAPTNHLPPIAARVLVASCIEMIYWIERKSSIVLVLDGCLIRAQMSSGVWRVRCHIVRRNDWAQLRSCFWPPHQVQVNTRSDAVHQFSHQSTYFLCIYQPLSTFSILGNHPC